MRDHDPRPARRPPARATDRPRTLLLTGIAAAAIIAVIAVLAANLQPGPAGGSALRPSPTVAPPRTAAPGTSGSPIPIPSSIACEPMERVTYHVHAHLAIRVDGRSETVPGTIGQTATCIYWLHTHLTDGVIHIEAPAPRTYTLGEFFGIWGEPLDATHVADWAVLAGSKLWAFVDGQPVDGDPQLIELRDLELIELQIGPAALEPLPYDWGPGFR